MQRHLILSSISLLAAVSTATAQWNQGAPANAPSARGNAHMTFMPPQAGAPGLPGQGYTMLFGGDPGGFPPALSNETWAFSGGNWQQLTPATTMPSGRAGSSLVWNDRLGRAVLYGGLNTSPFGGPSLDETWEWDPISGDWTEITSTMSTPGGLGLAGAAYHPNVRGGVVVIYGGQPDSFFPIAANQTWEYDGINWAQITTTNSPGFVEGPGMCYNAAMDRVVLFGGIDPQFGGTTLTWLYDGTDWTSMTIPGGPIARAQPKMVYDSARGVCVLHGGFDPMNGNIMTDTWEFDGAGWTEIALPAPMPPRGRFAMAYDENISRTLVFGGLDGSFNALSGTLLFGGYSTFGVGCIGSNGVPALSSNDTPTQGSSFTVNVDNLSLSSSVAFMFLGFSNTTSALLGPLPADLASLGMPGCSAYISADDFPLSVVNVNNGSAAWTITIPTSPVFAGFRFYNQAASIDPGFNVAGITLSNAGCGLIEQ